MIAPRALGNYVGWPPLGAWQMRPTYGLEGLWDDYKNWLSSAYSGSWLSDLLGGAEGTPAVSSSPFGPTVIRGTPYLCREVAPLAYNCAHWAAAEGIANARGVGINARVGTETRHVTPTAWGGTTPSDILQTGTTPEESVASSAAANAVIVEEEKRRKTMRTAGLVAMGLLGVAGLWLALK
mgnify:CR=1 FL=1